MYRMGVMALIAADIPGVDRDKLGFFLCSLLSTNVNLFFFFCASSLGLNF